MVAGAAALFFAGVGLIVILFPTAATIVLAALAFGTSVGLAGYALARRRRRRHSDGP